MLIEGDRKSHLLHSQGREMHVVFRRVCDVSSVMLVQLFGSDRVIMNITFDGVVFVALISQSLEEGRTSRTRTTERN